MKKTWIFTRKEMLEYLRGYAQACRTQAATADDPGTRETCKAQAELLERVIDRLGAERYEA